MDERPLRGKVALVTGAASGIGRVTAVALAERGAHVYAACRSQERAQPVVDAIRQAGGAADSVAMDLADLATVRRGAAEFRQRESALHIVVNNAGIAGRPGLSRDGFEITFATNHLGHFLLTCELLPALLAAPPSRVVNVSSKNHYNARSIDFDALKRRTASITGLPEYAVSKLCNVLFTKSLARRYGKQGLHAYALHPGVVASNIWRRIPRPFAAIAKLFMLSNEEGAQTSIYCATDPAVAEDNGEYYQRCRVVSPNPLANDEALGQALWQHSETWTGAGVTASSD